MEFGGIDKFSGFLGTMKEPISAMHQLANINNIILLLNNLVIYNTTSSQYKLIHLLIIEDQTLN